MTTLSPARQPSGPRIARFPSEPKILCEALFASHLQSSQQPSDGDVRSAIDNTLRTLSAGQCAAWLAQEFGDHPETAITRMRWATEAVASAYEDAPESQTRCMPRASACIHREYAAHSPRAATKAAVR
jgi:hypothetical protein